MAASPCRALLLVALLGPRPSALPEVGSGGGSFLVDVSAPTVSDACALHVSSSLAPAIEHHRRMVRSTMAGHDLST